MVDETTTTPPRPTARPVPALLVYAAAVVVVASIGGLATSAGQGSGGWYADADKPFFTPPDWVFGPVWTVLYAAMALAAWRLSRRRAEGVSEARPLLRLWWVQLALNFVWTPLFFAGELLWFALVDIVLLDVLLAVLVVRAWRVDRVAAALLAPYLAWVLYATALNLGIALLN
ncbi:MAG TPA: TspO/MBR family protein [Nocardioidaceae bacterium]|nr:TspO/MBR family protein [Nocardioidaceae bacterium]